MTRPISDAWFHRIKAATRDLVKACGGVVRAGEIAHVSKSEVSRWQSAVDTDLIHLPALLALESECGVPFVTRVMADLNGVRLAGGAETVALAEITARNAEVMQAVAAYVAAGSESLADLELTAAEAETLDRSLAELGRALEPMKQVLATVRAQGGARVASPKFGGR